MAETRWTDEQLSAINTRDKTLLVSAAAGSGKTATLTERIIRSLLDENSPISIDSLLVVTYTNAAAAELRVKISNALSAAVERNPENQNLKRQLYLLPSAKIRTIDSFCNEILRQNCDRVGLTPGYRIADTAECELLAISIIDGLIEGIYSGELPEIASPEEFEALADCLTDSKRTEELSRVFRHIHLKCECAEEGIHLLGRLIERYAVNDCPVEKNIFGSYIMDRYHEMVDHYVSAYSRYISIFSSGSDAEKKYLITAEGDKYILSSLKSAGGYEEAKAALSLVEFKDIARVKNADKSLEMERFAAQRKMLKADILNIKKYFDYTTEMWQNLLAGLHKTLSILYRFEVKFDDLFREEKRRLGALSYADIERYTYQCLIQDGKPTDIAINTARQYDAIYIDEYQDVNSLQNRIFEAIAKPNNRFMVGDIKQSIYGFRSARPEIFAAMKESFPPIQESAEENASIFMSRNFRCDKAVVDFVNNIFDKAFSLVAKSIGYSDGDRLVYSKKQEFGEPEYVYPDVCMIKADGEDEEVSSAQLVADKIVDILQQGRLNNGNSVRPSDIAIILRNASGRDIKYAQALEERGIPSCISGAKDFFLSPEILLSLCLLNSIDNPRRDIYLAGLMCSPLFGFTADELYFIKKSEGETLYESLKNYVKCNEEFTKGVDFLEKLNRYRAISEGVGVDALIHKLYTETGLLSLASASDGKENLILLYDFARGYEAGSFKGLYNFIQFINNIIDKKTTFDDARARSGVDAVKIVTSHASKGLEYPIVFFVESDTKIYNKDRNARLAFSEDFGISLRLRTPSGLCVVNNPVQDIINHQIHRKVYEEELRVLYVALTRARERLFVVGKSPTIHYDEYIEKLGSIRDNLTEYSFRGLSSYQEIILVCDGRNPLCESDFVLGSSGKSKPGLPISDENSGVNTEFASIESEGNSETLHSLGNTEDLGLEEELYNRFVYSYADNHLTTLPEKMSVSSLSPTVFDGTEEKKIIKTDDDEEKPILPSFIGANHAEESAKRGIATHMLLQFCDLKYLLENGAEAELKRLTDGGFLSKEDSQRVRIGEIEMFRKSDLISEMIRAKRVYRELRFNVALPASSFATEGDKIELLSNIDVLVQGVIDCIVEREDGSLAVYDYKTDRLTRDELANPGLAEQKLRESHKNQLNIYSLAVERIFGKAPVKVEVYSLPLGDTVSI